jgi:uncharacterized membrane protein YhiD involved in acid resistance
MPKILAILVAIAVSMAFGYVIGLTKSPFERPMPTDAELALGAALMCILAYGVYMVLI